MHSAGITGRGTVTEEDPDTWRRILEVNLTSAYLCCREAIPDMTGLGRGRIVLVASVNGRFGGSALSGPAYAASKGGLLTLGRFLAREHAARHHGELGRCRARTTRRCGRPSTPSAARGSSG